MKESRFTMGDCARGALGSMVLYAIVSVPIGIPWLVLSVWLKR